MAILAAGAVFLSGCEQRESVQWGYRGTSMLQFYKPSQLAKLMELNRIPDPEPSDPYDPTFPMATDVHQNVQVLTDLNALEFARLMNAITTWVAPEQGCAYCHNTDNLAADDKYTKLVAREMIKLTRDINTNWQNHVAKTGVTCWTCHRGQNIPSEIWFKFPEPKTPSAGVTGNKGGQNVAGVENIQFAALPFDPLTPFLEQDNPIAVQGTEALPYGNRQSIKQTEWTYSLMMYFSKSLGVNCTYCHHTRAMGAWDQSTPQRVTAWHGIRMVRDINQSYMNPLKPLYPDNRLGPEGDPPKTGCATCHKGTYKPLFGQSMLGDYPSMAGVLPGRLPPAEGEPETEPATGDSEPGTAASATTGAQPAAEAEAPAEPAADTAAPQTLAAAPDAAGAEGAPEDGTAQMEPAEGPPGQATAEPQEAVAESEQGTEGPETAAAEPEQVAAEPEQDGSKPEQEAADSGPVETEPTTAGAQAAGEPGAAPAEAEPATEPEQASSGAAPADAAGPAVADAEQAAEAGEPTTATEPSAGAEGVAAKREVTEKPAQATEDTAAEAETAGEKTAAAPQSLAAPVPAVADLRATPEAASPTPQTLPEIEAALTRVLDKLRAVRSELEALSPKSPSQPAVDGDAKGDVETEDRPPRLLYRGDAAAPGGEETAEAAQQEAASPGQSEAAQAELQRLKDLLETQAAELEAARQAAAAVGESEGRIAEAEDELAAEKATLQEQMDEAAVSSATGESAAQADEREKALSATRQRIAALEARLDQERYALQQQLEVVRTQRDAIAARIRQELTGEHDAAMATVESRLAAMNARLDQERHALKQQLEVVRSQRDEAEALSAARVDPDEHEAALAALERRIRAMQARLDQSTLALEQQLAVVRGQRDEADDAADERIAALKDDHAGAVVALERHIRAMQARLDQNTLALEQQLGVVRGQRDQADNAADERIAALKDDHDGAVAALERHIRAMQARLDQNMEALEQQLNVVRGQRDSADQRADVRFAEVRKAHEQALAARDRLIRAMQARLDQNMQALEQQLAVVRDQRDAAGVEAEERIAELNREHAKAVEALEARIAATEARLDQQTLALGQQLDVVRDQRDATDTGSEEETAALQQELKDARDELAARQQAHDAELADLNQRLADADAAMAELRQKMETAAETHAEELAAARGSVTRVRLMEEGAAEVGGQVTDEGILVNLGGDELQFPSGSAALPTRNLPTLDRTAALLNARPELVARVEGHTDSQGPAAINQALSSQRAQAVLQALVERGVDPSRLTAVGVGSEKPIADNDTAEGRRQNRRVEIYVTAQEQVATGSRSGSG